MAYRKRQAKDAWKRPFSPFDLYPAWKKNRLLRFLLCKDEASSRNLMRPSQPFFWSNGPSVNQPFCCSMGLKFVLIQGTFIGEYGKTVPAHTQMTEVDEYPPMFPHLITHKWSLIWGVRTHRTFLGLIERTRVFVQLCKPLFGRSTGQPIDKPQFFGWSVGRQG